MLLTINSFKNRAQLQLKKHPSPRTQYTPKIDSSFCGQNKLTSNAQQLPKTSSPVLPKTGPKQAPLPEHSKSGHRVPTGPLKGGPERAQPRAVKCRSETSTSPTPRRRLRITTRFSLNKLSFQYSKRVQESRYFGGGQI